MLRTVTRGPGATNAAAGVHIARQDSARRITLPLTTSDSAFGRHE
jgi:thiamine pyrophosphate-dependent acetolactate synthase large subunit-like protein